MSNISPYRENLLLKIDKPKNNFVDGVYRYPEYKCRGCGRDSRKVDGRINRNICGHFVLKQNEIKKFVIKGCSLEKDEHFHLNCDYCDFHWITRTKEQEDIVRRNSQFGSEQPGYYKGFILGTLFPVSVYCIFSLFEWLL